MLPSPSIEADVIPKKSCAIAVVLLVLSNLAHSAGPDLKRFSWRAVELYGNAEIADNEVLKDLPIRLGENVSESRSALEAWCSSLAKRLSVEAAECSTVFLRKDRAYLVIDIRRSGKDTTSPLGRPISAKTLPNNLRELVAQYRKTEQERFFSNSDTSVDFSNNVYLDFNDPELRKLAGNLYSLASAQKELILDVALAQEDILQSRDAAMLLNWVGNPGEFLARSIPLITSPDQEIRNSVTNYCIRFIRVINDAKVIDEIASALFFQLSLPTHTDRNKALYAILQVQGSRRAGTAILATKQQQLLEDIVARSHLPNISVPARRILQLHHDAIALSDNKK